MPRATCVNFEINSRMCPCPERDCPRWAVCCECVAYHRSSRQWPQTACQRGVKRPPDTLQLHGRLDCANKDQNLAGCLCTYDPCTKRGICCECIRNHWSADGTDRVACFR
ncbi:MAG: hypothetical protein H5T86_01570 [Armatimonadetes bacterium]|nr:hypothetical protein [Armatimonadota bacterium]